MLTAFRVEQWSKVVPLEILVRVQAPAQPVATGRPIGQRTIGPVLLGEGLASRNVLVPLFSSDSLWWEECMHADFGHQLYDVSANKLVLLAG